MTNRLPPKAPSPEKGPYPLTPSTLWTDIQLANRFPLAAAAAALGDLSARDRLSDRARRIENPWRFAASLATKLEEDAKRAEEAR